MRVFLVGYMACGKTTVGKKLSRELGMPFVDLDHYIVEKEGLSIPEIFEKFGEERFREFEARYLQEVILEFDSVVLSTGGGTPCKGDNLERMNEAGLTVYLKQSPGQLTQRLVRSKNPRPLIVGKSEQEILEFATEQLKVREPYYSRAKVIVDGSSRDIARVRLAVEQHPSYRR